MAQKNNPKKNTEVKAQNAMTQKYNRVEHGDYVAFQDRKSYQLTLWKNKKICHRENCTKLLSASELRQRIFDHIALQDKQTVKGKR